MASNSFLHLSLQRPVEVRNDVLVYTSESLESDLEVTGPLVAKIWASSAAKDKAKSFDLIIWLIFFSLVLASLCHSGISQEPKRAKVSNVYKPFASK
ncbi:CocE/NonD family hydrolase C-terminal non-catalytic domain-containing protein [Acidobacteriota bacterium]